MARLKTTSTRNQPKRPQLTHFLCLPLVTPTSRSQLETSFRVFKDDVATTNAEAGEAVHPIHPTAIRPVGSLHCTLGVMSLDAAKLSEAVETLQGLDIRRLLRDGADQTGESTGTTATVEPESLSKASRPVERPIEVSLKGLMSMHDPQKTSVLYTAPQDQTNRLLPLCLAVQRVFKERGFLVEDSRDLKLHATIMNTIYAKDKKGLRHRGPIAGVEGPGSSSNNPQGRISQPSFQRKIDATAVLEKYDDFVWAENIMLERISICEMGAKKLLDTDGNVVDEQYTEVASVLLST